VETDNFGSDYPDEKFRSESLSKEEAERVCHDLNASLGLWSTRWHLAELDDGTCDECHGQGHVYDDDSTNCSYCQGSGMARP
jgi:DnaJ-class molecular chaperone